MPHSQPHSNPPYPYAPLPSHRPSLPSIASSSLYLSPIQEQRILSWRTQATPPPITSSTAPAAPAPTPALTHSGSPTTTSPSSAAHAPTQTPIGQGESVPDSRIKVKSAPASLVNPAGGSLCKACGGSCGCSSTVSAPVPQYLTPHKETRPGMGRTTSTNPTSGSGWGSGTGLSRQRSYYSTKKYRQAKALALREQSGFGSGTGSGMGSSRGGGQGDQRYTAHGPEPLPAHMQPQWGQPDGVMSERAAMQQIVQADPIVNPTPRIAGARDPVTQHYWRNMFPPTGHIPPVGIIPGMQIPVMGLGLGLPPNMMGL